MPTARARAIALACCAGAAAAILLAGPLARPASSQQTEAAVSNPMAGDGMWIWYLSRAQGGNVNRIAKKAHRRGIEYVLVKSGDAGNTWSQFSPSLVSALHARGLRVCGWQFVYGRNVKREAAVGAAAVARGADCLVIDAEGHYEGRYPQASTYMRKLRALVGPDYPLALAAFPYADYHPAFPFSVFLGPGGAQYNAPQLYWKTIGDSVDEAFVHTWVFNRPYGRPILPLGQVYLNPSGKQISRFRRLAAAYGMEGVSWWSWQHAGRRQWKAVGKGVAPLSSEVVYDAAAWLQGRPGRVGAAAAGRRRLLDPRDGLLRVADSLRGQDTAVPAGPARDRIDRLRDVAADARVRAPRCALDQAGGRDGHEVGHQPARAAIGLAAREALRDPAERPPPVGIRLASQA